MMNKLLDVIKKSQNIAVLPHDNMDGDAFCSCHALKILIESMGVKCTVLGETDCIKSLEFLGEKCEIFSEEKKYCFDTVIAVDCADDLRFLSRKKVFDEAENKVVIDHHKTNKGFGDINIINPSAAAACQIIYSVFKSFGKDITKKAANLIYCGLVTDTGGFRFSNTTAETFETAAALMRIGVDSEAVNNNIFESKSYAQLAIEAEALRKAKFFHDGKTVIVFLSEKMKEEFNASDDDMSNISSMLRCIEGVIVSVTIKEKEDKLKVSMRSNEAVDVAEICASFGGGGHSRAAGASISGSEAEAVEKLSKLIGEYYERRN